MPIDPMWMNPTLLEEALAKSKALSAQGFNRTVVPQNPAVPNLAAKGDFSGIAGAPGDPTVGVMPRHPFQGVPLADDQGTPPFRAQPTPNNVVVPPDDSTLDRNELTPGGFEPPNEMQAFSDKVNIDPAGATDIRPEGFSKSNEEEGGVLSRFMSNPAASDALLAFGAEMLRAPDFNTGLGNAADALRKSMDYYKPLSRADREKLQMQADSDLAQAKARARLETTRDSHIGVGDFYDENNKHWTRVVTNGQPRFIDDQGQVGKPVGALRAQDSGIGAENNSFAKANRTADAEIQTSFDRLRDVDSMIALYDKAGTGQGFLGEFKRFASSALNRNIDDVEINSLQSLRMFIQRSGLLEAQGQRGLGQLTEGEREMIAKALPGLDTNPEVAKQILQVMRASIQRRQDFYSDWLNNGGRGSFTREYNKEILRLNDIYREEQKRKAEAAKAAPQGGDVVQEADDILKNWKR